MTKYVKNPLIVSGLFLVFSITFLSIFFNKISRDSLVEQVQHRQQMSVRLGARLIENLINSVGISLLTLSNNPNQGGLDQFVKNWQLSGISGTALIDKDGIVTKSSNVLNIPDLGLDLSDRDFYKWAKQSKGGEFKVFPPIISRRGATKGEYIIPIAVAMFTEDNKFDGVLTSAIPLSTLSEIYLDNIKILDSSNLYIVTSEGTVIYSENQLLLGKKYQEIFENDFLGKAKVFEIIDNNLKKDGESKFNLVLPNIDQNFDIEPFLISVSPINFTDQNWKVALITPEKDLKIFTYNTYNKQVVAVFVITFLFIILTLRSLKNSGYNEAVIDEHIKHNLSKKLH